MTLQQFRNEKQQKVDSLLKNTGVFFAFSNEQFEKNKTPLKEGDKYVSIGAGGYMPKSKVDEFLKGMKQINKEYKAQTQASKKMRYEAIAYELHNHECFYTHDITDALKALGGGYTAKEVWKVFQKENAKTPVY